jgi:hypothetical protein
VTATAGGGEILGRPPGQHGGGTTPGTPRNDGRVYWTLPAPVPPPSPEVPPRHQLTLAVGLLLVVAVLALMAVGVAGWVAVSGPPRNSSGDPFEDLERILSVVFGPLVTLLGTSFTWYYSSRQRASAGSTPPRRRRRRRRIRRALRTLLE